MVNPEPFKLSDEQIIASLRKENEWYNQKYGPYIEKRGLKNWKNLFRKPTIQEWTILLMLIMALFIGWAYNEDIAQCKDFLDNIQVTACQICGLQAEQTSLGYQDDNVSLILKEVKSNGTLRYEP